MTTGHDEEQRKKMIFDAMSPRRQRHISKKGYEKWNPFEEPKDPINMRMDESKRTSQVLIRDFMASKNIDSDSHGDDYRRGAFELCMGLINKDEKFQGMFDFACWYKEELKKQGYR